MQNCSLYIHVLVLMSDKTHYGMNSASQKATRLDVWINSYTRTEKEPDGMITIVVGTLQRVLRP